MTLALEVELWSLSLLAAKFSDRNYEPEAIHEETTKNKLFDCSDLNLEGDMTYE